MKEKETTEQNCTSRAAKQVGATRRFVRPRNASKANRRFVCKLEKAFRKKAAYILCAFMLLAFPASNANAQDITTGLVGHWTLDETTGTTAADSSGNGNDGTVIGTDFNTDSVTGVLNSALNFEGGHITINDDPSLDLITNFTLSAWIKRSVTGQTDNIINKAGGSYVLFIENDDTLRLTRQGVGEIVISTTTITDTEWHHVVATYDGTIGKLYIDGVDVSGVTTPQTLVANTSSLAIGARPGGANLF